MTKSHKLAHLLNQHMKAHHLKDIRLARHIEEVFKRPIVSSSSIRNWRNGTAQTVRDWRQLLAIASVLSLTQSETEELLQSANLPTLDQLWVCAEPSEHPLFINWVKKESPHLNVEKEDSSAYIPKPAIQEDVIISNNKSKASIKKGKSLPHGSYMPLRPFPLYTGRENELNWLAEYLLSDDEDVPNQVVVTGIGGIGKTQLAVEFAYRYGHYFPGGVFFLNFDSSEAIVNQIALCGSLLALDLRPDYDSLSLQKQSQLVQRAWHEPVPRLLIFDSCDENKFEKWQPNWGGCRILITSRREIWDPAYGLATLSLSTLNRKESIALLDKFLSDVSYDEANHIADILGDHPLALRMAGHFLHFYQADISPQKYIAQLTNISEDQNSGLLEHPSLQGNITTKASQATNSHMNLQHTFLLSYEKLDTRFAVDALSRDILMYTACLMPGESISREFLDHIVETSISEYIEEDNNNLKLTVADALGRLSALGLIQYNLQQRSIWIHQLVIEFIRGMLNNDKLAIVEQAMISFVEDVTETNHPTMLRNVYSHFQYLTKSASNRGDELCAGLYNAMGDYLLLVGMYDEAKRYLQEALQMREELLGAEHPQTATTLDYLGYVHQMFGDWPQAEQYHVRALAINEQRLGLQHKNTAKGYHFLGLLYSNMGDYKKANLFYEKALAINKKILPNNHPHIAFTLNGIGIINQMMGAFDLAKEKFALALNILESELGENHPDVAMTFNNLGKVYLDLGNPKKAESCLLQGLEIAEQALPANHPNLAIFLKGLGHLHETQESFDVAKPYYKRALAIYEQVLGDDHQKTIMLREKLGL